MPTLKLDGDSVGAVKATTDVAKGVDKISKSYTEAAKEAKKLEEAAKRIVRENEGPQDRFNRKCAELTKHMVAGRISANDFSKAMDRYRAELDGADRGQSRVLATLGKWGLAFGGITTGLAFVKRGFDEMEKSAQSAADSVINKLGAFGELQQVSTSPEDYMKNIGFARSLVRSGAVPKGQESLAADITFGMVSAGYSEAEKGMLAQMAEQKFVKPEGLLGMAESLGKLRRTFGDKETGSLRDIANKVIQAAGTAQASVPQTLAAVLEVAGSAKAVGMGDEEAIGGFLAVEAQSPNAEVAATKYRSFIDQANKRGLWKGNLQDTLKGIKAKVDKGKNVFDVLGENRAVYAYQDMIAQMGFIQRQTDALYTAPGQDLLGSRSSFMKQDPTLYAGMLAQRMQGSLAVEEERRYAEKELLFDALRADRKRKYLEQGGGALGLATGSIIGSTIDMLGLENQAFIRALSPDLSGEIDPEVRKQMLDYQRRQTQALEELNQKTPRRQPAGRAE